MRQPRTRCRDSLSVLEICFALCSILAFFEKEKKSVSRQVQRGREKCVRFIRTVWCVQDSDFLLSSSGCRFRCSAITAFGLLLHCTELHCTARLCSARHIALFLLALPGWRLIPLFLLHSSTRGGGFCCRRLHCDVSSFGPEIQRAKPLYVVEKLE